MIRAKYPNEVGNEVAEEPQSLTAVPAGKCLPGTPLPRQQRLRVTRT